MSDVVYLSPDLVQDENISKEIQALDQQIEKLQLKLNSCSPLLVAPLSDMLARLENQKYDLIAHDLLD